MERSYVTRAAVLSRCAPEEHGARATVLLLSPVPPASFSPLFVARLCSRPPAPRARRAQYMALPSERAITMPCAFWERTRCQGARTCDPSRRLPTRQLKGTWQRAPPLGASPQRRIFVYNVGPRMPRQLPSDRLSASDRFLAAQGPGGGLRRPNTSKKHPSPFFCVTRI